MGVPQKHGAQSARKKTIVRSRCSPSKFETHKTESLRPRLSFFLHNDIHIFLCTSTRTPDTVEYIPISISVNVCVLYDIICVPQHVHL